MKVLICDDLEDRGQLALDAVKQSGVDADVDLFAGSQLAEELQKLFRRAASCVANPSAFRPENGLLFDKYDVGIFDNNLAQLDFKGARLTAEDVVGYVRAFSDLSYVVSLNKNPDVGFDLRYLIGDFESSADVAVNTEHLANLALWTGNPADAENGFLPWYWPRLAEASARRREQVGFLGGRLGSPLLEILDIPAEEAWLGFLSRHARGSLVAETDLANVAGLVDVFVARNRSIPAKEERKSIAAALAGNEALRTPIARVVAAEIDFWFRRDLLAPQELVVDLPHLLMRMPFLLGIHVGSLDAWNAVLRADSPPFGLDHVLYNQHLAASLYPQQRWTSAPTFFWPQLKADEELSTRFFEADQAQWIDAVFCEDTSLFVLREDEPAEFSAQFDGSWSRRFVRRIAGVNYAPVTFFG